jgi:hypothetical protein
MWWSKQHGPLLGRPLCWLLLRRRGYGSAPTPTPSQQVPHRKRIAPSSSSSTLPTPWENGRGTAVCLLPVGMVRA